MGWVGVLGGDPGARVKRGQVLQSQPGEGAGRPAAFAEHLSHETLRRAGSSTTPRATRLRMGQNGRCEAEPGSQAHPTVVPPSRGTLQLRPCLRTHAGTECHVVLAALWLCHLSHRHSFPRIPVSGLVWPRGGGQRKAGITWDARSQPRSQQSVHPSVHMSVYTGPAT